MRIKRGISNTFKSKDIFLRKTYNICSKFFIQFYIKIFHWCLRFASSLMKVFHTLTTGAPFMSVLYIGYLFNFPFMKTKALQLNEAFKLTLLFENVFNHHFIKFLEDVYLLLWICIAYNKIFHLVKISLFFILESLVNISTSFILFI